MLSRLSIALFVIITMAQVFKPFTVRAETINTPVFIDFQQLQLLMIQNEFKVPNNT